MKETNKQYYKLLQNTINYKEKQSLKIIEKFLTQVKRPYIAFSGGKDSTVMLHLISKVNKDIDVFTEINDLDFPDKLNKCDEIIEFCGIKSYYTGYTERLDIKNGDGWFKVVNEFVLQGGYNGLFMGLRREESKGRRININKNGLIYNYSKNNKNNKNMSCCLPIGYWKGEEIFAYIIKNNLPYHKIYDCDDFKKPHEIRFSWTFDITNELCKIDDNAILIYKKYFPEVFKNLCEIFGENIIRGRL